MSGRQYWSIGGRLLAAAGKGASAASIASAFGMSVARVEQMAAREGVTFAPQPAPASPELHHCLLAIFLSIPAVQVPRWVPADLADEFLELAAESGEEAAASAMRRLKRELMTEMSL